MKQREHLNTAEGFAELVAFNQQAITELLTKLQSLQQAQQQGKQLYPLPNVQVIANTQSSIIIYIFDLIKAKYSAGYAIADITPDYYLLLHTMAELWEAKSLADFAYPGSDTPYYIPDQYWQVLSLISLGILLEVSEADFARIIQIRDKVATPDVLLDFLLASRDQRIVSPVMVIGNKYTKLTDFLLQQQHDLTHFKTYITKYWYRDYQRMGKGDSHKSKFNIHDGYWGFELGAIAKILQLDDQALQQQKYYPYDLVHWQD